MLNPFQILRAVDAAGARTSDEPQAEQPLLPDNF